MRISSILKEKKNPNNIEEYLLLKLILDNYSYFTTEHILYLVLTEIRNNYHLFQTKKI